MASYNNIPVLAKIKVGNQVYWMKDADARAAIDALESGLAAYATIEYVDQQIAAEVERADGKYATAADLTSAINRIAAIEGDYLKAADKTELKGLITAEETRATGVEGGLDTRIRNLEARGRYLSTWDAATGLPGDYPTVPAEETGLSYTYTFKAGDYYIINNVPSTGDKYMPKGSSITATRTSTTAAWVWTAPEKEKYTGSTEIVVGGQFVYSTTGWNYVTTAKETSWGTIIGNLEDQSDLNTALGLKEDKSALKGLAYKDSASGTVESQTIKDVKATFTPAGSVAVSCSTATVSSTGKFTPVGSITGDAIKGGSITVTVKDAASATAVTDLTYESYTPAGSISKPSITVSPTTITVKAMKTAGTDYSITEGSVVKGDDSKSKFVKKAMKMEVGTGEDAECLIISEVATTDTGFYGDAVTAAGSVTYTAPVLSGALPTFEDKTVINEVGAELAAAPTFTGTSADIKLSGAKYLKQEINAATFTPEAASLGFSGTEGNVSVSGNYDKANAAAEFTGTAGSADVGDIVVAAKTVTVQ